jgi:hypothetical protein
LNYLGPSGNQGWISKYNIAMIFDGDLKYAEIKGLNINTNQKGTKWVKL